MQPKTEVKFDRENFNRLKRTMRNMSETSRRRKQEEDYATPLPDEVGIQLTNRCNLRCKHCFEWNEKGFHHQMSKERQNQDIDLAIIKRIFEETKSVKSNLYLWGGEPLSYKYLNELADMLVEDPRWTVFCTNGIEVQKNIDALIKMSPHMAMLISLEGFEVENDAIRGKGTFNKVIENIKYLLDLKKQGIFKGEISVNCVISEQMLDKMYDFMVYFEELGVNTVYFCFPWYISEGSAKKMDEYFKAEFNWLYELDENKKPSWHAYTYHLDPAIEDHLIQTLKRINERIWKIRIRYQPALELDEVGGFIRDEGETAQHRKECLAISNRMNVMADGKVTACKLFNEFTIGDLSRESVSTVWNSEDFKKIRSIINKGLMPICSKCILLYLHGK